MKLYYDNAELQPENRNYGLDKVLLKGQLRGVKSLYRKDGMSMEKSWDSLITSGA